MPTIAYGDSVPSQPVFRMLAGPHMLVTDVEDVFLACCPRVEAHCTRWNVPPCGTAQPRQGDSMLTPNDVWAYDAALESYLRARGLPHCLGDGP